MADSHPVAPSDQLWQHSVNKALAFPRKHSRERLDKSGAAGSCSYQKGHETIPEHGGDAAHIIGVRFRGSSRLCFYGADDADIATDEWVVVSTAEGLQLARVVISPRQMLVNQLEGELGHIERRLGEDDVQAMEARRARAADIKRRAVELVSDHNLTLKIASAGYTFDGSRLEIGYSSSDQYPEQAIRLKHALEAEYRQAIDIVHVGPRDEARAIGGLGKGGRLRGASSGLSSKPKGNMGMANNPDVSLSQENDHYRQAKRILPRLGELVTTPDGPGIVVSVQTFKNLVAVRLDGTPKVRSYPASDVLREAQNRLYNDQGKLSSQGDQRRRRPGRATNPEPNP